MQTLRFRTNQPKKLKTFFFLKVWMSRTRFFWKYLFFVHFEPFWAQIWPFWDLWDLLRGFLTLFLGYLDTLDARNTWKKWFELSESSNLGQILAKKIEKISKNLEVENLWKKYFFIRKSNFKRAQHIDWRRNSVRIQISVDLGPK